MGKLLLVEGCWLAGLVVDPRLVTRRGMTLQNAAAEVSKITQKHTKTHKYTEIKKLFLFVKGGLGTS